MKRFAYGFLGFLAAAMMWVATLFAQDANLSWQAPTTNEDGSPLTDLAGYRVYRSSTQGGPYTMIDDIPDPLALTYLDASLGQGLYCYVITAYDDDNLESVYSNEACKIVDTIAPGSPAGLVVF